MNVSTKPPKNEQVINDGRFERNGVCWNSSNITFKLSGQGNYILAKLKLLDPKKRKSLLVKDIIEKALLDLEKKITEL
ncbi:hypothetical protein ABVL22_004313 [Salmonella enterica]